MSSVIYRCAGCMDRLEPTDEVRELYRELADVIGGEDVVMPRWAYAHIGHEPQNRMYRITGRGTLANLERERKQAAEPG